MGVEVLELLRRSGVTAAELQSYVEVLTHGDLTVREALSKIAPSLTTKSQETYAASWRRLVDGERDLEIDGRLQVPGYPGLGEAAFDGEVTLGQLEERRDRIRALEGWRKVTTRQEGNGTIGFVDPDAEGFGASDTWVDACRALWRRGVALNLCARNPARELRKLRHEPDVHQLSDQELSDIRTTAALSTPDPELDALLIDYFVWTGWRREAALNQARNGLDAHRAAIATSQKGGKVHVLPAPMPLVRRLVELADSRGASGPLDRVFVTRRGRPVDKGYVQRLFARVRANASWARGVRQLGPHTIRHALLTRIERAVDLSAAAAWAGHSPNGLGTTGRYLRRYSFDELVAVAEATWGRRIDNIYLDDSDGYRFATRHG